VYEHWEEFAGCVISMADSRLIMGVCKSVQKREDCYKCMRGNCVHAGTIEVTDILGFTKFVFNKKLQFPPV
jgi:hypothetical protein